MARLVRRDQLLWALGAVALVPLFAQTWARAHRPGGIDLTTYLEAARAVLRGDSPYALALPFPYMYPPFLAFALIPLSYAPANVALVVWFLASVTAIVWSVREVLRLAYPDVRGRSVTPFLAILFVLTYTVLQSNLRNAQVNPIVVALAIAALGAHAARSKVPGATCWAAAIAIKIVPAVLAPFYLRRREWQICGMAAFALVVLVLMPAVTLGAHVVALNHDYVTSFLAGSFGASAGRDPLDFSLGGLLTLVIPTTGAGDQWLRAIGAVLPMAIVFAADRRVRTGPRTDALAFALYLAVIPLASPKSEVHHLLFALPLAALAFGARRWRPAECGPVPSALLVLSALCYLIATAVRSMSAVLFCLSLAALVGAALAIMTRLEVEPQADVDHARRL